MSDGNEPNRDNETGANKKESDPRNLIIVIAVVIILLLGGALAYVLLINDSGDSAEGPRPEQPIAPTPELEPEQPIAPTSEPGPEQPIAPSPEAAIENQPIADADAEQRAFTNPGKIVPLDGRG